MFDPDIGSVGREVLFLHAHGDTPRLGEGSFIRLRDNSVMFAFTKFSGESWHDNCAADIACVISSDEGESWSEMRIILHRDKSARNVMCPSLIRLKNGNIGMIFARKEKENCLPFFSISSDEGQSFSDPLPCMSKNGYFVIENDHICVLESGRIMVPMNYHERIGEEISGYGKMQILASDDDGKSWQIISDMVSSPVPPELTQTGLQESALYQRSDGAIRALSRTDLGCQWECVSNDEGVTWSTPLPNRFFTSAVSPLIMKNAASYTVAVFNPVPEFTSRIKDRTWGRSPLICAVSETKGESFERLYWLETDFTNGYAYPAIFDGGDYMLVSYYHSDGLDGVLRSTKIIKIPYSEISK